MKVTIGGQYQGETDAATAEQKQKQFKDTVITARCIVCGHKQELKLLREVCNSCGALNWK